jgi:hypothetical protein
VREQADEPWDKVKPKHIDRSAMEYYRNLLDSAFRVLSGEDAPSVLSLVHGDGQPEAPAPHAADQRSEFPSVLRPSNAEHHSLPGSELFVEEALAAVRESDADCVFVFPPLPGRMHLSPEFCQRFEQLGLAQAVVRSLIEEASEPAKVFAFLLPSQFLAATRSGSWRREFFPSHSAVVVEHTHDLHAMPALAAGISMQLATLIFSPRPGPVRFFRLSELAIAEGNRKIVSDMTRLLQQPAGKTQFGYVHRGPLEGRYATSFDSYSEETERLRQEVGELGDRVQLAQIADVLSGYRPCDPRRQQAGQGVTGFLTICARDITRDGRVDLHRVQTNRGQAHVEHCLEEGDFCISVVYRAGRSFTVGVYKGDGRPVTWRKSVIVVRPHASLLPAQRQVLLSFLRSPLAQRLGSAEQRLSSLGRALRLSPDALREFPVPIADKDIMSALQHLSEAREAFGRWISDIDDASNAIVQESTAAGSRERILASGQLARQRFRAATQVEELDYRVRTQFPHPLAYVWREVQICGPDRFHRLRAIMKAAEGHTCFLAQLGVLLSKIAGKPLAHTDSMSTRLCERHAGTSFGDWFAIVREIGTSRAFRGLDTDAPVAELRTLCVDGKWEPAVRRLMDLRNDDSHGRIASTSISIALLTEAEEALETVYRTTEFLTDFRLLWVTSTRFDSIRHVNHFEYRDLSGDNALAPLHSDDSKRSDLESGSLYLQDRRDELHLLRPMLHYLRCPECHQMATFFLDALDTAERDFVRIKSFERNSVRREAIADDFRHVGLLK